MFRQMKQGWTFLGKEESSMALVDNNSILMSIKKLLNVDYDDPAFDMDILMLINKPIREL